MKHDITRTTLGFLILLLVSQLARAGTANSELIYADPTSGTDPNYVLVYQGKYFDWYAYQSTWNIYNSQYLSQVNYPDQVYDQLVKLLDVDVISKTPHHRLYLLVNQQTGGGFATGNISEIGKGPGIGIAYDAWLNIYSGNDTWSTELVAHEMTNLFTGQIVSGWPRDWWADDKSPFPYAFKIIIEQNLGNYDASNASLHSADSLTKMFLQFMSTYGTKIYSRVLQAIETDGWSQWFGPNPSLLLSEYVAAYLSIGAGTNLANQINTAFLTAGISYQLNEDTVQRIWNYRQYLQQFPRDDPKWQSFRQGDVGEVPVTTDKCFASYLFFGLVAIVVVITAMATFVLCRRRNHSLKKWNSAHQTQFNKLYDQCISRKSPFSFLELR